MTDSAPRKMKNTNEKWNPSPSKTSPTYTRKTSRKGTSYPEGKKAKQSTERKQFPSPSRTALSENKTPLSKTQSRKSKTKVKDANTKDDKKKETTKMPELTKSGLKIIDWSGQGMTSIPFHLITAKDVGHLIVSSNNLQSVPTDIVRLKNLEKLDISRNGIRCTNNNFSGLPEEMALLTNLTELCISECNLPFIPPAIFKMTSLKVLDMSRNKINFLLPEIGNLINLVRLNLQQTNITSLPPEIAYCQELEEIYLWGNSIETLPETLSEMPKLRVLAMNYRSFCGVVDSYMENLLRKGQIKSEHIPMVVFELPALEVLDLENTKLNTLPDIYNNMLKEFYLCKNFLQTIPQSIYNLKHIQVLDISNNCLSTLPEDIGHLKVLRILRLAVNNIEKIPSTICNLTQLEEFNISQNRIHRIPPEIKGLTALRVLILAKNQIQSLPDEICQLTQLNTLDLTGNEIHSLPVAMYHLQNLTKAHSYHKLEKCGLWLYKNPLVQPPPEIWRSEKPDEIFQYLKKLVTFKIENLQRQKIQLLGESQCGKTSLMRALTLRKSWLTNGSQDKTRLLHQTLWKTDNKVEFVLNDFGGDNAYRMLQRFFLDSKALVLLVYNVATLCEENFYSYIGQWLDMLSTSTPGTIVKLVGTQADLLHTNINEDEVNTTLDQELKHPEDSINTAVIEGDMADTVPLKTGIKGNSIYVTPQTTHTEKLHDMVSMFLNSKQTNIKTELELLQSEIVLLEKSRQDGTNDNDEAILKMMKMREKKLNKILQNPLKVLPDNSIVSASESLEGILRLNDELEHLAIDKTIFPHAQQYIPGHWKRFRLMLKQRKGYHIYWDDIEQTAELFGVKDEELRECMKHLHNTAHVLWFHEVPGLCEIVFHKPKMLVNILASLYRHDIADFMTYDDKVFLCKGRLSRQQFEECVDIFDHTGEISRPLLNCLWFPFSFTDNEITQLLELLSLFEVCYCVPEPSVPTTHLYKRPLIVLPWYNKDTDMFTLEESWPIKKADNEKELAVVYSFPFFCPPEIFPSLSAQIQDSVDERIDRKDYVYATCDSEKMLLHRSVKEDKTLLTVLVRGPKFTEVQTFMQEITNLVNNQLLRYPGLYWEVTTQQKSAT